MIKHFSGDKWFRLGTWKLWIIEYKIAECWCDLWPSKFAKLSCGLAQVAGKITSWYDSIVIKVEKPATYFLPGLKQIELNQETLQSITVYGSRLRKNYRCDIFPKKERNYNDERTNGVSSSDIHSCSFMIPALIFGCKPS